MTMSELDKKVAELEAKLASSLTLRETMMMEMFAVLAARADHLAAYRMTKKCVDAFFRQWAEDMLKEGKPDE
jgi:hypothetical protein